ncbi:MAG: xanthine dehydrogenase family protein subunit M [Nitriliruptorales bacterium]|nr:xanthine dehydrogenase family protein subunit M [Nitriliruptorales bacterium]
MYPRAFRYARAESLDHAIAVLAEHGPDAQLLAGGATIIPLMKYRLRTPAVLVDIGRIDALRYVRHEDGAVRVGALTRHADVEHDPTAAAQPLIGEVAGVIADTQVRNMGTVVGGVCAVEPTGDWVPALLALRGTAVAVSPEGRREIASDDLVVDAFTTSLRADEVVTEVRFPDAAPGFGAAHRKLSIRVNAGAVNCSAAVTVAGDGAITAAGVAFGALERRPFRATAAESVLVGATPTGQTLADAVAAALDGVRAYTDARGSAAFRRAVAGALLRRAVTAAYERATDGASR